VDLTGGLSDRYLWSDPIVKQAIGDGSLWKRLLKFNEAGFLLGCGSGGARGESGEEANEFGILQSHAYSMLDLQVVDGYRLLLLRNPWGRKVCPFACPIVLLLALLTLRTLKHYSKGERHVDSNSWFVPQ
jgi:hypothetical protein